MRTTRRHLKRGDTVILGNVQASKVRKTTGRGILLLAAWDGEPTEYIVVTTHFSDGDEINTEGGQVLAITEGRNQANPQAWILVPADAYAGGSG